jgi:hypothetical protein
MQIARHIMDFLTILFPKNPQRLREALLRQQGKGVWQIGDLGVFVTLPEDYCDGHIYTTRLPAVVISETAEKIVVQAGEHHYVCTRDGNCLDGYGVLVAKG